MAAQPCSAACALLLAVIGIYGVLSFSISRRTREMGIRLALADTRQVFLLVVRDGMLLVGLGILIGLGGGLAGARSLTSFLHDVSTTDVPTFAATVTILSAWRSSRARSRRGGRFGSVRLRRFVRENR